MKTVFNLLCLSILINTTVVAQNRFTDSSATCIAFWSRHDSHVYKIRHVKSKTGQNDQILSRESNYEAHIKVVDSTEKGFTIEWTYKNFQASGVTENVLNSLETIMDGIKFIYKTDDMGMFSELVNWEQVRDRAFASYEKAIAEKGRSNELIAALKQVKSIFNSKENIESVLIKEVQLFHTPYGREYNKTAEVFETELPNVTGGSPFPANITIVLDTVNIKNDLINLSISQTIDKGKAGPIIVDILKKISATPIKDETEMKRQVKEMEISDISQYTISLSTGWIKYLVFNRTSKISTNKQVETYQISEIEK